MIYNIERPSNFDEMIGQEMVVENIRNQSIKGQFFPVFILCGQYGSGKTTMARIIAMAANCEHKDEQGNPCGKCDSCRAVLEHSPEGIIEIDGASNNGVDSVRKLLIQATTLGLFKKKVIVIDEAHMLSKSAFNALLITLENPPQHCIFILCTTEKDALPDTVVSRAPVYTFGKIADDLIKEHILKTAQKNKIWISEDAAGLLSRYADGAMRNALQLLEYLSLQKLQNEEITDKDVINILGLSSLEQRAVFLKGCLSGNISVIINTMRSCEKAGISLKTFIQDVLEMNTDILLHRAGTNIVGTKYYLDKIKELADVSDSSIIRANRMLSAIASTPSTQLNAERIIADIVGVMHVPMTAAEPVQNIEYKNVSENAPIPPKMAEKASKNETADKIPDASDMTQNETDMKQMKAVSDDFQKISEDTEIPFKEETADTPKTKDDKKEKEVSEENEMLFGLFEGGLFGCSVVLDDAPKNKSGRRKNTDLLSEAAMACKSPEAEKSIWDNGEKSVTRAAGNLESEEIKEVEKQPTPEEFPEKAEPMKEVKKELLKDSVPVNTEGRMTWDEAAALGIVPKKVSISLPEPESKEELDAIYAASENEPDIDETEEEEEGERRFSTRADLLKAHEELSCLVKNPAFRILFSKARMVEKDFHIYLYFENAAMVTAMKIFLKDVRGISAVVEEK